MRRHRFAWMLALLVLAPLLIVVTPPATEPAAADTDDLRRKMIPPIPQTAPAIDDLQVVGLETWLSISSLNWLPVTDSDNFLIASRDYLAVPDKTIWTFSDGVTVECNGRGTKYRPGDSGPAPCGRDWHHTTSVLPVWVTIEIEYDVVVVYHSPFGSFPLFFTMRGPKSLPYKLDVGEIQAVGTLGDQAPPTSTGLTPELASPTASRCSLRTFSAGLCDGDSSGFNLNELGEITFVSATYTGPTDERGFPIDGTPNAPKCDAYSLFDWNGFTDCLTAIGQASANAVIDGAQWAGQQIGALAGQIYDILPAPLQSVIRFIGGCASFGIEVLQALWDTAEAGYDLATERDEYIKKQIADLKEIIEAIGNDPGAFIEQFGRELFDADLFESDQSTWAGKMACEVAAVLLSGGAAGGARAAKILAELDEMLDWARNQNKKKENENHGGCNSFPTGTHVLMADGSHRPIQMVQPGQRVLAANPATGVWRPRLVLDQWSHIDEGSMATATMIDGSRITATDDHRFWVASDGSWRELDDIGRGDLLLTPNGVTRVAGVTETGPRQTLVWELDVAVDDSFAVSTGTVNVLVHNDCKNPVGNLSDKQRQQIPAGAELGGLDAPNPSLLDDVLRQFRTREIFDNDGNRFVLDKSAIEAILKRHHPRYFDPAGRKTRNTSFDGESTVDDLVDMMQRTIREGRRTPSGTSTKYTLEIDGIIYDLAVDNTTGRVADHFSPLNPVDQ